MKQDQPALVCTEDFIAELKRLSPADQNHVRDAIGKLAEDPRHTSLQAHRFKQGTDIWGCRANYHVRILYTPAEGSNPLRLWYVGQHQLVDKAPLSFAATKVFISVPTELAPSAEAPQATADDTAFQPDAAWFQPVEDASEPSLPALPPLAHYPAAHLRFLGVPAALVEAVQQAPNADAVTSLPGLPEHTILSLLDLFTNPRLEAALFDPARLLYRATLDTIEGFCTGRIKKLMLNLTPPQERCVRDPQAGFVVLRGVAGSGKTTVGLYRAIARAKAGRRVLLLTYNKTLVQALQSLVQELEGAIPPNLEIRTVDGCLWHTAEMLTGRDLADPARSDAMRPCLQAAIQAVPGARELASREHGSFFMEELDGFILARGIYDFAAYRDAERIGRGAPLGKQQRQIVWAVLKVYRKELQRRNLNDHQTIAAFIDTFAGPWPMQLRYDDILIDESQDVTLVKLRAVTRLLRPSETDSPATSCWLLTDAAQTIYTRGIWWQEADLPQPPQRLFLRRNHRNTEQILTAAARLMQQNTLRARETAIIKPERATHVGPLPQVQACGTTSAPSNQPTSWHQEQRLLHLLQDLCDGTDFRYSDFAVLCPTNADCKRVAATIEGQRIPVTRPDDRLDLLENSVKVLTFYSAKGLEFPVVFLYNVVEQLVPHPAALRGFMGEERAREIERQRALFYVAMTRAADMLYLLTGTEHEQSSFLGELGETVQRQLV